MFFAVLLAATVAASANGIYLVADEVVGGLVTAAAVPVSIFLIAEFIFALAVTEQPFLAAHAHFLLVSQLPVLAVYAGMIAGYDWKRRSWMSDAVRTLVIAAVVVAVAYGVWGYIQGIVLGHRVDDQYTLDSFYTQLGMEPGIRDARYAQDVIVHILFTRNIFITGAVSLVVSALCAFGRKQYAERRAATWMNRRQRKLQQR